MNRRAWSIALVLVAVLLPMFFACGGDNGMLPPPPPIPPAPYTASASASASAAPLASAAVDAGLPAPDLPPPLLVLGAASPDPSAPLPTVRFTAPLKDQIIPAARASDLEVRLEVKHWQTARQSQHVHVILDNEPYFALYEEGRPIKISEMHEGALAEGQHVLVAFPSRPNHESVKTAGALAITEFWVGKKGPAKVDITKPLLVYSRPKGEYAGDHATHVLIDFQLANVTLDGNAVTLAMSGPGIDGVKAAKAERFGPPFYLENPQTGSYVLKLELVDESGKLIPNGAWNSTTREFQVKTEDGSNGAHAGTDGGAH